MTTKFKEGDELITNNTGENRIVVYIGRWACSAVSHAVKNSDGTVSIIPEQYLKKKPKTKTVMMQDWWFSGNGVDNNMFFSFENDIDYHIKGYKKIGEPYTKTFEVPE